MIAHQVGKHDTAVDLITKALAIKPDYAEAHNNLGIAFKELGRLDEAVASYHKALAIKPDYAEAHYNLGNAFKELGRLDEAVERFHKALSIKPDYADAHINLGAAFKELGRLDEAVASYHKALAIKPDYAEAHYNLGIALQSLGKLEEAVTSYHKALAIRPDQAEAHNNLGAAFKKLGRLDEAVASCHEALAIQPDYAEAHINLGIALKELGRLDEAVASYHKALTIKPDYAEAHINLGNALRDLGKLEEAVASYHKALVIKPDYAEAHVNLGNALRDLGKLYEAVANYRKALAIKPDYAEAHSNLLFALNYGTEVTEVDFIEESRDWNRRHASVLAETLDHANDRSPDRRLRIGYVSPDMCRHSVSYFFEPLLAAHDPAAVEAFCYAEVAAPDATTWRLETLADHWRRTVGMNDAALAENIRADGIDILVDLAGHTAGNRLLVFARRPAPVQVSWLGYPNTTGLKAMDYRLVDAVTDPEDEASETLVRLANGFLCYRPPDVAPPVAPSRPAGPPIFGSFNNITKVTASCIELWSRILTEVPEARLLLKSRQLADAATRELCRDRFAAQNVAPERLELLGPLASLESHLGLYADVDVGLDPFPYNGTTTTCEALWMGVPVVTLRGGHHRGRVGASPDFSNPLMHRGGESRKMAIRQSLTAIPERPRCKQSVAQHCSNLNRLNGTRLWPGSMAESSHRMPEGCCWGGWIAASG